MILNDHIKVSSMERFYCAHKNGLLTSDYQHSFGSLWIVCIKHGQCLHDMEQQDDRDTGSFPGPPLHTDGKSGNEATSGGETLLL